MNLFRVVEVADLYEGIEGSYREIATSPAAPRNDNVGDEGTVLRTVGDADPYSALSFFLCHHERSRGIRFPKDKERILRLRLRLRSE